MIYSYLYIHSLGLAMIFSFYDIVYVIKINVLPKFLDFLLDLQGLNISNCHKITHVGLSSLTNGADSLKQLNLACGFAGSLQCLKVISYHC